MTDKRNIAHDKKVQQEKKHRHEPVALDAAETPQPGRKPHLNPHDKPKEDPPAARTTDAANADDLDAT